ncbi:DMT family transporter (plasmid) [Thioclava litoralis]|uniref:DMT family transporter n=1 Tax=Thioclava litoralis TaxID=3076557 RepID=A0ABZ1E3G6_9RHOB|nr:DMT family transporter [Thioclava sp. FTW29]
MLSSPALRLFPPSDLSRTGGALGMMVLLWGLSWPATQMALQEIPPLWLATFRFGSAALCLFAVPAVRGAITWPKRADLPIVLSIALLQMTVFTGLGMIAMTVTDTSHAVLLAYTTPLWTVFLGAVMLRQRPSRAQLVALGLGLSGIALVCSPLETDWTQPDAFMGAGFLLIGAICWSGVIVHIRRHRWHSSPLALAPWQMALAALCLGLGAFWLEGPPRQIRWSLSLVGMLVFIGPVATSLCFVIAADYGRRISAFAMSNVTLGVPLIGIAASVLLLANRLSLLFLTGLALVFCGMVLAARATSRA